MAILRIRLKQGGNGVLLKDIVNRLDDPRPALEKIGFFMRERIRRGFRDGGRNEPWPDTMQPNVPALAKRISEGKGPVKRYLGGAKKPLVDTGQLRDSIDYRVEGDSKVVIGTGLPYAEKMQTGGTVSTPNKIPELLKQGNKRVKRYIKQIAKDFPKAANVLSTQPVIKTKIRRRPFLVVTKEDVLEVKKILQQYATKGL